MHSIISREIHISSLKTLVIQSAHNIAIYTYINIHAALQASKLKVATSSVGHKDLIETIDSSEFPSFSQPKMSIEIPTDLVRMCSNMSGTGSNGVRLVSFLYANVTGLLPSSLPGDNRYYNYYNYKTKSLC